MLQILWNNFTLKTKSDGLEPMFISRILLTSCCEAAYLLFIRATRKQAVFFGRITVLFDFHSIGFECESAAALTQKQSPRRDFVSYVYFFRGNIASAVFAYFGFFLDTFRTVRAFRVFIHCLCLILHVRHAFLIFAECQ